MSLHKIYIRSEDDIYIALGRARSMMKELAFSDLELQKVLVCVSELTRNVLDHAHARGVITCEEVGRGIRITVEDEGPGIEDIEMIMKGQRFSSKSGLGLGLSGVKRLMDEFDIKTSRGGTKIIATKWRGNK